MSAQIIDNRYRIIRKIGEGGMGMVYQAIDERLGREVAVKRLDILNNAPGQVDQFVQRFQREAKTMAQFNHPNIVSVFDYGQDEEGLYLVIEYMPGGTLEEHMGIPMTAREAAALLLPIANALNYVHERGIVHRDIKPANILFDVHNNPMLTDFGIVKLMDNSAAALTAAGGGVGTPTYMAPEQMTKDFDHRVDQYSLGIIFYELVTGKKPYQGDTPLKTLYMHANQILPDPRLCVPDLPQEACDLIRTSLAKKREDRYPSMIFFAHALQRIINLEGQDSKQRSKEISESETLIANTAPLPLETAAAPTLVESEQQTPIFLPPDSGSVPPRHKKKKKGSPLIYVLGCGGLLVVGLMIAAILIVPRLLKNSSPKTETPSEIILQLTEMAMLPTETEMLPTNTSVSTNTPQPAIEEKETDTPMPQEVETLQPTEPSAGAIWQRSLDNMPMIYIPAGVFTMGTNDSRVDQRPAHEVWLEAYWVDQYEVSNQQYAVCVSAGVCLEPVSSESETREEYYDNSSYFNYPVLNVTWSQANAYCTWAGGRLPTEAEWEKAARGTDGRVYPWGDEFPDKTRLNYNNLIGDTSAVGSYATGASPYGVMDMAGNVREWVLDWYGNEYYQGSPEANPTGPEEGEMRGLRGGAWQSDVNSTRAVYRNMGYPQNSSNHIGFRCVSLP
ncbi:MAG: SUMF1/EgtB/PvdO family nonheme iron enzyme [Anaerolineaceae bacterium]|nr:SUMF1/EgtB/PvdO family nonheme iron enzyme [Anaerolineaceae bacterium]